jgi:hypothetical protein
MKGSFVRALAVAAGAAVVATGVALAANTGGFADPTSDAQAAPDLSAVAISNDDAGTISVKLTIANRGLPNSSDLIGIGIDTDQNPDTGSAEYGAEYEMFLILGETFLFRANADGSSTDPAPLPPSLQVAAVAGSVTFSFKASDFGITSGFKLFALTSDDKWVDAAPDIRTFNYQLAAGTSAPLLGRDTRAPVTAAVKSRGTHGKNVDLFYSAADGRGETTDTIVVYRGKRAIKRFSYPLGDTSPFYIYSARWKVPKKTKGKFRFCVTSTDRAGNKSKASCAALTIK